MLLALNNTDNQKKLYQQIYGQLKEHIMNRDLQANEKLPSKRELAKQLNVSVNTVTNAYEQLIAEGYIFAEEKKGYYVENIAPFINDRLQDLSLPNDLKEKIHTREGWLSLSHNTCDAFMFPFREWMKCQQKAITNHKNELSELCHFQGPYILRHSITRMIAMSRGIVCEPEQIVIGASTQLLIGNLLGLSGRDTVIGAEYPGYSRFYSLLKNMEFNVRACHLDEKGIAMEGINATDINYLFITPSHQLPTGKIMPVTRRIQLLNWSTECPNRYIIEDDYDSEFKYETDSIPSLQSLDQNQRVIYTGAFSKTILPGLRISFMVLPPNLLRQYKKRYEHTRQTSNSLMLYTLHYFIETGAYARHVKKMNLHYEMKRKRLIQQIKSQFGKNVIIEDIPAGLHFLAKFRTKKNYKEIEKAARNEKIEIYTIKRFITDCSNDTNGTAELVLGYANIEKEQIKEAVDRLGRVLR
jgi:GntR family transcriptional regulator/MocR family aminotransferase